MQENQPTQDNSQPQSSKSQTKQVPPSAGAATTGSSVGHYILGKTLGEGTFGKVRLGTHILTGEKVAVKVLEKSKIKDKKDVERISREIKILKKLHHPNVVQIYEIIETERDLYLVMEFASGGELFELIVQNQRLKEKIASKHFQELVAGVHYIHKLGICHRDLKPENLLLDFDGQLKVVDFGLSNMYEMGQTLKTACGSPCYAAPEMIAGNRYHGLGSDIWSIGVVLYAMLCGYLPFEDQKTSNLYKKILSAEYSLPKFLSADAKDMISKLFVTDPEKRIDIDAIRRHPFYLMHQPENQNFSFHTKKLNVNLKLVAKMEVQMGFNQQLVEQAVQNNKHNHLSATYYLLLKKYTAQALNLKDSISKPQNETPNHQSIDLKKSSGIQKVQPKAAISFDRPQSAANKNVQSPQEIDSHLQQQKWVNHDQNFSAPVQDILVQKQHRREQSANATANRYSKNDHWGSPDDDDRRRADSCERADNQEEYEILGQKAKLRETKEIYSAQLQRLVSPSPENARSQTNSSQQRKKQNTTTQVTSFLNQSYIKPVKDVTQGPANVGQVPLVNLANVKQQIQNYTNTHHLIMAQTAPTSAMSSQNKSTRVTSGTAQKSTDRNQQTKIASTSAVRSSSVNQQPSSAMNNHRKSITGTEEKSKTKQRSQSLNQTQKVVANSYALAEPIVSVTANATQNLTNLMNNLSMLSQKINYDSIVNKHLRSSQQPADAVRRSSQKPIYQPSVSQSKERSSASAAGNAKLSATMKPTSTYQPSRYGTTGQNATNREQMTRTLEQERTGLGESRATNELAPREQEKRSFYDTQPIQRSPLNSNSYAKNPVQVQLAQNIRPSTATQQRQVANTMATLNSTLIPNDDERKSVPAKAHRSSVTGPTSTNVKSSSISRAKESIPSRGSGSYMIPTQSKDSQKRSSSQRVSAQVSQSHNFSSTGYQQRSIDGSTKTYSQTSHQRRKSAADQHNQTQKHSTRRNQPQYQSVDRAEQFGASSTSNVYQQYQNRENTPQSTYTRLEKANLSDLTSVLLQQSLNQRKTQNTAKGVEQFIPLSNNFFQDDKNQTPASLIGSLDHKIGTGKVYSPTQRYDQVYPTTTKNFEQDPSDLSKSGVVPALNSQKDQRAPYFYQPSQTTQLLSHNNTTTTTQQYQQARPVAAQQQLVGQNNNQTPVQYKFYQTNQINFHSTAPTGSGVSGSRRQ